MKLYAMFRGGEEEEVNHTDIPKFLRRVAGEDRDFLCFSIDQEDMAKLIYQARNK